MLQYVYRSRDITALTATTSTADCMWWIAPAGTSWFFEYPCSIRIWKAGPKSSCHLVLFMAYSRTMSAVLESGQLVKLALQAALVSFPLAPGVMFFNSDCGNYKYFHHNIIIKDVHAHT